MRVLFTIVVLMGFLGKCWAQQDPIFNKYMFNPLFINPAYAGSREMLSTTIFHRSQWVSFEGAPETQTFTIHTPLVQKKVGLGLAVVRDVIGPTSSLGIMGCYAYRLPLLTGKLSFGLRTSLYQFNFAWDKIEYRDFEFDPNTVKTNYMIPSFDFGIRYHDHNKYLGISAIHLNQPKIQEIRSKNGVSIDSLEYGYGLNTHFNVTGGYAYKISEQYILKPSILIKASTALNYTVDVNMSVLFDQAIWAGVSYRSTKALIAMLQYDINENLSMGYSYEQTLSKLRNYNSGSHELFLRFDVQIRKSTVLSPRYF